MLDPVAKLIELAGPKPRVALAFSGGVDSTVLAHLLVKQRRKLGGLRLLHVDHGLQPASAEWSRHCARMARSLASTVRIASRQDRTSEGRVSRSRRTRCALRAARGRDATWRGAGHRPASRRPGRNTAAPAVPRRRCVGSCGHARHCRVRPRLHCASVADGVARRNRGRSAQGALALDRRSVERRYPVLAQFRAPATDANDPRALARRGQGAGAQRDAHGRSRPLARRTCSAGPRRSRRRRGTLGQCAARTSHGAPSQCAARIHRALQESKCPKASRLKEMSGPLLDARADAHPKSAGRTSRLVRSGGRLQLQQVARGAP